MLRKTFNQAVVADYPGALKQIQDSSVNLAVWQNPLSPETLAYIDRLPLKKLTSGKEWRDGYYAEIGGHAYMFFNNPENNKDPFAAARKITGGLPAGEGREALSHDIVKLARAFSRAVGKDQISGNFLVFKPVKKCGGFWHTDKNTHRGIITLKGNGGTLWRPNHTLVGDQGERNRTYWGDVDEGESFQELSERDFAIFKCNELPEPLVHATPPASIARSYRLALLMGPR